jgi:hypothetical protein
MQIQAGAPAVQFQVAVEKKAQDTVKEQGQQAVALIAAAAAPPGTGTKLNLTA